jgi:hypothetical protein
MVKRRPTRETDEAALEEALVRVLTAEAPIEALHAELASTKTRPAVRAWLQQCGEAGVRVAALLVAQLRFGRLIQGSDDVARFFDEDPAGFAQAFRSFHGTTPACCFFPVGDARAFWQHAGKPKRTTAATRRSSRRRDA